MTETFSEGACVCVSGRVRHVIFVAPEFNDDFQLERRSADRNGCGSLVIQIYQFRCVGVRDRNTEPPPVPLPPPLRSASTTTINVNRFYS